MIFKDEEAHRQFLDQINTRVDFSMSKLSAQRDRWDKNYKACTAYILHEKNQEDNLKMQQELSVLYGDTRDNNDNFYTALPVKLAIPYTFAIVHTICTIILAQFTGQRPYFPVKPIDFSDSTGLQSALMLEQLIQYQLDSTNYVAEFHKATQAACITGCGPLLCSWDVVKKNKFVGVPVTTVDGSQALVKQKREVVTYQGNKVTSIDPFYFIPDPRVPMHKIYSNAEFVFWIDYNARFYFTQNDQYQDVELVQPYQTNPRYAPGGSNDRFDLQWTSTNAQDSDQYLLAGQSKFAGGEFLQLIEGTVYLRNGDVAELVSKTYIDDWGLDTELDPGKYQKYLVSMLNGNRIIQVRPFDYTHDNHPVVVLEPLVLGTTFGSMSMVDLVMDFEKIITWLFNTRVANVQQILNSKVFFDFSAVNPEDMSNPMAVYIPIQGSVYGGSVGDKVHSFVRPDVTATNFASIQQIITLVELIIGVSPIVTGQPMPSGRRTASESRLSAQSSSNRIGTYGKLLSSLGTTPLGHMFIDNIQQFMNDPQMLSGDMNVNPTDVLGNFQIPIYDGMTPIDTQSMIETWGELLKVALQDQQLRASTDVVGMYADLGTMAGFRNFDRRVNRNAAQQIPATPIQPAMRGNGASPNQAIPGNA